GVRRTVVQGRKNRRSMKKPTCGAIATLNRNAIANITSSPAGVFRRLNISGTSARLSRQEKVPRGCRGEAGAFGFDKCALKSGRVWTAKQHGIALSRWLPTYDFADVRQ